MTEQTPRDAEASGTAASGRDLPEQPAPETGTTQVVPRQVVPEQAGPPAVETVETAEGPEAPEAPEAPRPHRFRRRRPRRQSAFRRWRKTRPFWGGLITMLAGAEIALVTGAAYELILISRSVGIAIAVGACIAALGLTMWLSPELSKLLGLFTEIGALLSFVTSNLGGFLIGMLLAIIGGGLAFAWEPGRPTAPVDEAPAVPDQRRAADVEEFEPLDRLLDG